MEIFDKIKKPFSKNKEKREKKQQIEYPHSKLETPETEELIRQIDHADYFDMLKRRDFTAKIRGHEIKCKNYLSEYVMEHSYLGEDKLGDLSVEIDGQKLNSEDAKKIGDKWYYPVSVKYSRQEKIKEFKREDIRIAEKMAREEEGKRKAEELHQATKEILDDLL